MGDFRDLPNTKRCKSALESIIIIINGENKIMKEKNISIRNAKLKDAESIENIQYREINTVALFRLSYIKRKYSFTIIFFLSK